MHERIFPLRKPGKLLSFGFFLFVIFLLSCSENTTPSHSSDNPAVDLLMAPLTHRLDMVSIPGGSFQMGSDSGNEVERPVHTVTLDAFKMSATEITNSQYSAYLNTALRTALVSVDTIAGRIIGAAGNYRGREYMNLGYPVVGTDNQNWIKYNSGGFQVEPGKENLPVVYVTWYGAYAFAEHYGMRLPTEAEWEYAARAGAQFEYGTDNGAISKEKANFNLDSGCPRNVGSYQANPFGLYDMAGNVWEWCSDRFGREYYKISPGYNPLGPDEGSYQVLRGGGWINGAFCCRSAFRRYEFPDIWDVDIGFRVVSRP